LINNSLALQEEWAQLGLNQRPSDYEELQMIHEYQPKPGTFEERSKDFWMFSYMCNGMNFTDIAHLRYSNLNDDMLIFHRSKTKRTSRGHQKPIVVPLLPEALVIIKKYGNRWSKDDPYIFQILKPGMDPFVQIDTINTFIQVTNKSMKDIATKLEINKPTTTYVARHTFATVLKRSGASMEFISEQLGHSSLIVTESYLDSFETQIKRDMSHRLLDFSSLPPKKEEEK
jgi:integrase